MKQNTTHEELCNNLPPQLKLMLDHVYELAYEEEPKYDYLIQLLEECGKENGEGGYDDWKFSWNVGW